MNEYVLDAHPLIWYSLGSPSISSKAREIIASAIKGEALCYVSHIVLMEITFFAIKRERHKEFFDLNAFFHKLEKEWKNFIISEVSINHVKALPFYLRQEVMVDNKKERLELHDALIMALAKEKMAPLVTRDPVICGSGLVTVVW